MTAFDTAWALSKFDFHFQPKGKNRLGHHLSAEHNKTRPSEYASNKEYDRKPIMRDIGQQQAAHYRKDDPSWVDLSTVIDKPATPPPTQSDKGTYHRGESTPRLNDDGSYTGVNLSNFDFTDDSKWDENVERIANTGAHETVHRVQNDDVTEWAKEQTGYGENKNSDEDDLWSDLRQPSEEEKQQTSNYHTLRSIGHEFGAYSLTPDSSQPSGFMSPEKRKEMMSNEGYKGSDYSKGNKPLSDLRQKSESMTAFDTAWALLKIDTPDYQGHHKAPIETDYHVPIFNLNAMMPDIYSHPEYYGVEPEHMELLNRVKNDPSQQLSVYRSVPKGVQTEMNAGDWVTPFREYAEWHGERFDEGYDIIEELVAAHDLLNEGSDVQEYGWLGHRNRLDPDVAKWIRSHMMEEDE